MPSSSPTAIRATNPALALYTEADAWASLDQLQPQPFGKPVEVAPGVTVQFDPSGHILGLATLLVHLADGPTIRFSGELGERILLRR
jgi:Cft2 family RNA processing exonuclease